MYMGYLFSIILAIATAVVVVALAFGSMSKVSALPPWGWEPSSKLLATATLSAMIAPGAVYLVVVLRYVFRGYMGLHKHGVRWAQWQAWGAVIAPVLWMAILATSLALVLSAESLPVIVTDFSSGYVAWFFGILGLLAAAGAFGLFLAITHILYLDDMYRRTNIQKFRTAFTLYIVALVLSFVPFVGIVGWALFVAVFIIEMLAYREASIQPTPQPTS